MRFPSRFHARCSSLPSRTRALLLLVCGAVSISTLSSCEQSETAPAPETSQVGGEPSAAATETSGVAIEETAGAGRDGTQEVEEETAMEDRPEGQDSSANKAPKLEVATFGAGCFWCVEAVLEQLDGIHEVTSGYMGGSVANPTYEQVCTGRTGHAEVVQIHFDPQVISYEELLGWFWKLHDPTTLNRQGADKGTQYRSAIFYHSPEQQEAALAALRAEDASGRHLAPIVTEVTAASAFYSAEEYHQDFYRLNPRYGYCRVVIDPKLEKLGLERK